MERDYGAAEAIVTAIVALAIIALILLARGTPDHSRYDDAPASVTIMSVG